MKNIQGIIIDVDGVIVGEKVGVNSPNPHNSVIKRLKELQDGGIKISLCTAKPHFAITSIINDANLDNLHIADGGGVIIDPIDDNIVQKHLLDSTVAKDVLEMYIKNDVYVEFYTPDNYYSQKDKKCKITKDHAYVLQAESVQLDDLATESVDYEITKIMPVAKDKDDKDRLIKLFSGFKDKLKFSWGVHPVILPLQFGIVTAPGISKAEGATAIADYYKIDFENMLGVGDSASDWQFISMCKYGAAMGNAGQDLKDLVLSKGENGFVGPSVDDHGILDILDYFINQ